MNPNFAMEAANEPGNQEAGEEISAIPELACDGEVSTSEERAGNSDMGEESTPGPPPEFGYDPDLWLYRQRTLALLKRYFRLSIEVGRLPSLLGRELFRSKVTSYSVQTFEDAVIFVHDVERILDQLDPMGKDLIAVIVFQDYSQDEAAEVLRCARRTVCRQFPETVDRISELFLEGGLLNRLPARPAMNWEPETVQMAETAPHNPRRLPCLVRVTR